MSADRMLAPVDRLTPLSRVEVGSTFGTIVYEGGNIYQTMRTGRVLQKWVDGNANVDEGQSAELVTVEFSERRGAERLKETLAGGTPVINWGRPVRIAGGIRHEQEATRRSRLLKSDS